MKKLVAISILLTLLTAAAFAQFKVGLEASFYPDLLLVETPTGENANTDNRTGGPGTFAGSYDGNGRFAFLSHSNYWAGADMDLTLSYKDPKEGKYEGSLQLNAENWIRYLGNSTYDASAGSPTYVGNGQADANQSVFGFLNIPFGDCYLKGTAGILTAYVGNTANRGKTVRYHDNMNTFFDANKVDNYGILVMGYESNQPDPGDALRALDINNLRRHTTPYTTGTGAWPKGENPLNNNGNAYLAVTADLSPITVAVAGDFGTWYAQQESGDSWATAGAAIRVSGEKIADLVTFDAIYKFYGADIDTDTKINNNGQPDGNGLWDHAFGVYANLDIIENLGIGVGYSGAFRYREQYKDYPGAAGDNTTFVFPYLNGIDLRVAFTGVDKLNVTFNNNVSFSYIQNDDNELSQVYGVVYHAGPLTNGGSGSRASEINEGYLALYNALGITYNLSDALSANVTIGNTLLSYTQTNKRIESDEIITKYNGDTFETIVGANYSFSENVELGAGLAFRIQNTSIDVTHQDTYNGGLFSFGIPLAFKVKF
jgi:hypothetical protein